MGRRSNASHAAELLGRLGGQGRKATRKEKEQAKEAAATMGSKGGLVRGELLRAGAIPITGAAAGKPTKCDLCKEVLPTARKARAHRPYCPKNPNRREA